MTEIGTIQFDLSVIAESASRSLLSALEVLGASDALRDRIVPDFGDLFSSGTNSCFADLSLNAGDLLVAEPVFGAANGALKLILNPSDRYLDLVAAITRDGDVSSDFDFQSWPILSVVPSTTTVRDAGGESIPAGGATQ